MGKVVIGSDIIILGEQFDEFEEVEGLSDGPAFHIGIEDCLGVSDQLFDRVGER